MCNVCVSVTDKVCDFDKKVQRIVSALNKCGFRTTGSCEGHIERSSPVPWIAIIITEDVDGNKIKEAESRKYRGKIKTLLGDFYRNRDVPEDVHIVTRGSNSGFWLHNGGSAYAKWRLYVEKSAVKIARGEKVKPQALTKEEKRLLAENLPIYQKEMDEFAKFLETAI